jgi:hypothetical protein
LLVRLGEERAIRARLGEERVVQARLEELVALALLGEERRPNQVLS